MIAAGAYDVIIVGGGPVGSFLGCRLAQLGRSVLVLEAAREPRRGSRAIGVHPPSLERLAALGVAAHLIERGVRVRRGLAIGDRGPLGQVSFARCPGPYRFVLTVPQWCTEESLERRLRQTAPEALRRGARAEAVVGRRDGAEVVFRWRGHRHRARARFIVGCDGRRSLVRQAMGVTLAGRVYDGQWAMGDFPDRTALGASAAIYLSDAGLVESFPLPGRLRRWVVEVEAGAPLDAAALCARIAARTGQRPNPAEVRMLSQFRVEQQLAQRFARGRLALAGDAAHQLSPFGGQGLNLGWLDAWALAAALDRALLDDRIEQVLGEQHGTRAADVDEVPTHAALAEYDRTRRRAARAALRRAALNTALGHRPRAPRLRNAAIRALLTPLTRSLLATVFTMRGL